MKGREREKVERAFRPQFRSEPGEDDGGREAVWQGKLQTTVQF